MANERIRIDTSVIPDCAEIELARVAFKAIQDYFSNMTPEQKEKYELWKAEYRKRRAVVSRKATSKEHIYAQ